jgi:hypothetical protein
LLALVEMIDAEANQRIGVQALRLDGVVTNLAKPERPGVEARERRVHLPEQATKLARRRGKTLRVDEATAPVLELVAHPNVEPGFHGASS